MSEPPIATIRAFYDDFSRRLLADYVHGNPRIEAALAHVIRSIPPKAKRVLDIGCGIGWTTFEIKRHFPDADVVGIDLSSESIAIARRLFDAEGARFEVADVTDSRWRPGGAYDAIVLCDVYEHVPDSARPKFDRTLAGLLAETGVVILTFPSAQHQEHLAHHDPGGLQPVDETITQHTLNTLATTVGGSVQSFRPVRIWNTDDYVHATLVRGLGGDPTQLPAPRARLEAPTKRANRARTRLARRVTHDGLLLPDNAGAAVLIVAPLRGAYSETFIRAHMESLPTRVEVLFGDGHNMQLEDGRPMLPRWARRLGRLIAIVRAPTSAQSALFRYWFSKLIRRKRISVVLAEYGPTAVAIADACSAANVPFVAHFHGFDAYDREVIARNRDGYDRVFARAAAIVAVSTDMERQLVAIGARPDAIHRIPSGVDVSRFSGATPERNPPLFIAVGRFVEKKAPHLTL
ncbi:MAG: methyltransferase domain-containing protein, partial [Gammaproteobacteria bacterium]